MIKIKVPKVQASVPAIINLFLPQMAHARRVNTTWGLASISLQVRVDKGHSRSTE